MAKAQARTAASRFGWPAIIGVLLFLTACTPILQVGDSVTLSASTPIVNDLTANNWAPAVDGQVNRTTAQGLEVIRLRRGGIQNFVIALGYNDAGDSVQFRDRLWAILGELRNATRVWVVNLNESRSYYVTANQIIAVSPYWGFTNMRIIDWASVARANPWAVSSDGVHLTSAGTTLFAKTIADTVGRAPF